MRTFSGPVTAALASAQVGLVQLVKITLSSNILLNTSTWNLTWGGDVYIGANGLGTINPISDSSGEVQGLSLELAASSSAIISLALDAGDQIQGAPIEIRTAIVDFATGTILDAPLEWIGKLDTMGIVEDSLTATVKVTAESRAVDLLRGKPWLYSHQEQLLVNASDNSFKFVIDQIDKPIVWPSKEFFKQ
jgi:hypothetical protein